MTAHPQTGIESTSSGWCSYNDICYGRGSSFISMVSMVMGTVWVCCVGVDVTMAPGSISMVTIPSLACVLKACGTVETPPPTKSVEPWPLRSFGGGLTPRSLSLWSLSFFRRFLNHSCTCRGGREGELKDGSWTDQDTSSYPASSNEVSCKFLCIVCTL